MQLFGLHYLKNSNLVYKAKYRYKFRKIACLATCMKEKARKEIQHSSIRTQGS